MAGGVKLHAMMYWELIMKLSHKHRQAYITCLTECDS
jgi:hypothetical protein